MVVQRDGVGVEQGKALALLVHLGQALDHEPLHDAVAGVLRVGAHTGHKAHMVNGVIDVHLQRVDRELGDKVFAVKAAQYIGAFQHGKLGLLDLIVLPAGGGQLFFGDLKGVPQQGVILIDIIGLKIANCIIFGGIHGDLPLFFARRFAEQFYYTPGAETPARKYFHKKRRKPARKTPHLLENAARPDFCIEPLF